ncbi:MAG: esterase family protein [Anaerolineae bacterium]|nr:esterase family protein [Anaerolineae bacterium]
MKLISKVEMSLMTWLERARDEGTPLIDGDQVTFVWYGEGAEPAPILVGDFNDWDGAGRPIRLEQVDPDVWAHTLTLPADAYIEYAYMLSREERLADPFNPHVVWNGMDAVNHVFIMPECDLTDLVARKKGVQRGTVTRHLVEAGSTVASAPREVYLYQPPVTEAVPLVVVWDGPDYMRRAYLCNIVDNLIAQGRIAPIALALLGNGGSARMVEYTENDTTLYFVREHVLPLAQTELNLIDIKAQPGSYGVLGASMGGLMALWAGVRMPEIFGKVISQSGAFGIAPDGREMLIDKLIKLGEGRSIQIWQDAGTLEWLLTGNRKMHELLRTHGYNVIYHEFSGGHNYTMWSNTVWRALEVMFGKGN